MLLHPVAARLSRLVLTIAAAVLCTTAVQSQTKISDYVIFSGSGPVQIGSSTEVNGGAIGSNTTVKTTGNATINAAIFSRGTVTLSNSNTVTGRIAAANGAPSVSGNILSVGSSASLRGDIDVNGNILVGGGTVSGRVTHPPNTVYSGPNIGARNVIGTPNIPQLPALPAVTNFPTPPPGTSLAAVTATSTLNPGWYGNATLSGNKTVTLNGPGTYVFNKFAFSGSANNFVYDFTSGRPGNIYVYVIGDANFGKFAASIKGDGTPARIFVEVHGTGSTTGVAGSSLVLANGSPGAPYKWLGTAWAPYGAINIGSGTGGSSLTGALYSGTQVVLQSNVTITHAPFAGNRNPVVPFNGNNTFKVSTIIGAELTSIVGGVSDEARRVLAIQGDDVFIEVVVKVGMRGEAMTYLLDNGMDTVSNGFNPLSITGKYPIANLLDLNNQGAFINFVQPVYAPTGNSGLISDAGDTAMGTYLVRNGFKYNGQHIGGAGVKIGVLSDSYNTLATTTNNPAENDVITGELPGAQNPVNTTPVQVLLDYPYFPLADEGRAMLQIVHAAAPKAQLAFRTGFISQGDLAEGIVLLQQAGCQVIVDDITYINEPFLKDGPVAKAVDKVKALGVTYFSSAGNFSNRSYEGVYNPAPPPAGLGVVTGAHAFGTGDIYQKIRLKPGSYTIALQWQDDFYSLGETTRGGAANDFDLYLTDDNGVVTCGYNRVNAGGDPFEFMAFTVDNTVAEFDANILIVKANAGSSTPTILKYIIFRGNAVIAEWSSGNSTIIGHANAAGAIAVGAVNYFQTPAYGRAPVIAPYSSVGGPVAGVNRNKPEISAPDAVNTSVNMGPDIANDADPYSNFAGTSAAAPHAAAAAALLIEGRQKFTGVVLAPDAVKALLQSTALPFGTPSAAGAGLIRPDEAMRTFASPTPSLISLAFPAAVTPTTPPADSITLTIQGEFFKNGSVVYFRGQPMPTAFVNNTTLTARVPGFTGNPSIRVYSAPLGTGDGGYSNLISFFDIPKKTVRVTADNKTKKYGERLPVFTSTVTVFNPVTGLTVPLSASGLTLTDVGLQNLTYTTNATALSNVGNQYFIKPVRTFSETAIADQMLLELYKYDTIPGILTIERLGVTVTTNNQSIVYGQPLAPITFQYNLDPTANFEDVSVVKNRLAVSHQQFLEDDYIAVLNNTPAYSNRGLPVTISNGGNLPVTISNGRLPVTISNGEYVPIINPQSVTASNEGTATVTPRILTASELANLSFLVSDRSLATARTLHNQTKVIDVPQEALLKFYEDQQRTTLVNSVAGGTSRGLLGTRPLINRLPVTISNGMLPITISNQLPVTISNAALPVTISNESPLTVSNVALPVTISNGGNLPVTISNGGLPVTISNASFPITISNSLLDAGNNIAVIVDSTDAVAAGVDKVQAINTVTGLTAGLHYVIPAPLLNDNFNVRYLPGTLTVNTAPLTVSANNVTRPYGDPNPPLTPAYSGFTNGETLATSDLTGAPSITTTVTPTTPVGTYPIVIGAGTLVSTNYAPTFTNGVFTVTNNPCLLTHTPHPSFNGTPKPDVPTSLWVNVEIKLHGQLAAHGDYLSYQGGTVTLNNAIATPLVNNAAIPNGKIIADASVPAPVTHYDAQTATWITRVPPGYHSSPDLFISGAIINSSTGFTKKNNFNSVVTGIFYSNKAFNGQWSYGMAAYRPQFTYSAIQLPGQVASVNGTYKAGTPIPVIGGVVGGGNDYTGSSSSMDNFAACYRGTTALMPVAMASRAAGSEVKEEATGMASAQASLRPNPASSRVTFSFTPTVSGLYNFTITSMSGRIVAPVHRTHLEKARIFQKEWDTGNLPAGTYILQVVNNASVLYQKFVIAR